MTHFRLFSAFGLCAVAFLTAAAARRELKIPAAPPVPVKGSAIAHVSDARRGVVPEQKRQAAKLPVVREVDLEGLKKILRRDPERARPLLVNFWATWCDPCREEFPDLVRIDADYQSRGLEFVTVSLDEVAEIKTGVPQFLQRMRAPMPAYLLNVVEPETAIAAVDPAWGGGLPATFLFDRRGRLAFKHLGRVKPNELRAAIEKVVSDE